MCDPLQANGRASAALLASLLGLGFGYLSMFWSFLYVRLSLRMFRFLDTGTAHVRRDRVAGRIQGVRSGEGLEGKSGLMPEIATMLVWSNLSRASIELRTDMATVQDSAHPFLIPRASS